MNRFTVTQDRLDTLRSALKKYKDASDITLDDIAQGSGVAASHLSKFLRRKQRLGTILTSQLESYLQKAQNNA